MSSECRSTSPNGRVCLRRFGHGGGCSDGTYMWVHPGTVGEVRIIDSPRPENPEAERERLHHDAYRAALEEIADILQIPGSPSLLSMPARLRERLRECAAVGGDGARFRFMCSVLGRGIDGSRAWFDEQMGVRGKYSSTASGEYYLKDPPTKRVDGVW